MKPVILPILQPQINWSEYLKLCETVLGREVTRTLDAAGKEIGDAASFIGALGEMSGNFNYNATLENPGSLLRHLFYGFLTVADEEDFVFVALNSGLSATIVATTTRHQSLGLLTGNLEQWRTAIINLTVEKSSKTVRAILNEILWYFERIGLTRLWIDYSRTSLKDGTTCLSRRS